MKGQPWIVKLFFAFAILAWVGSIVQFAQLAGTPLILRNTASILGLLAVPCAIVCFFIVIRPPKN